MVLQEQTHQFLISDAITNETHLGGQRFNAYGSDLRANTTFSSIHSLGERMSRSIGSDMSHSRHLMDLLGAPNEVNHHSQGLSLSLGSRLLLPSGPYDPGSLNPDALGPNCVIPGGSRNEIPFASTAFPCSALCGTNCLTAAAVGNSVYMKPTLSLLEETVSVGGEAIHLSNDGDLSRLSLNARRNRRQSSELKAELCGDGLSFAENHVVRSRIAKLIALLEEVDSRHEEYYQQLEEVVSSFEAIAGFGAAKSYTALALQAMSRHFCNLRDAILSQINSARRKVPEGLPKISTGLSQLSLFDQENRRSHLSLQQIGMVQNPRQAWRPIRGLPETSVAFLRAWLFEHFLHPYPNDSEKIMLASQTGLTKNQVSNWFINARVRLWKPMIEEMYKEEFADSSVDIESDPLFAGSAVSRESDTDHSNEFTGVGSI